MRDIGAEMVVVVDEYGGTEGLLSYDTVIDYLFGDFAPAHEQTIVETGDDSYRVAGGTEIGDVEELLHVELEGEGRTVAGFIVDRVGDLPKPGDTIAVAGYRFTVESVDGHRVEWVTIARGES
jgi:CBS domain containing-hemolysin-like protein